jgi:two-component system, chemotaxis family, sensor kinase Cph1
MLGIASIYVKTMDKIYNDSVPNLWMFVDIFSTDLWPPRWRCGYWSDLHGWTYIISDILIGLAYVAIPLIILRFFIVKKSALRFGWTYLLFASFIMLCGTTHFIDAIMFWVPVYKFNALVLAVTAVVSIATVIHLIRILPMAFKLKTSSELEAEIAKRIAAEERLAEANKNLQIFSYAASHDLKEPLRKLSIFSSELLNIKAAHDITDREGVVLNKISQASEKMRLLVDDLSALASIDHRIKLENVQLSAVIQESIDELNLKIIDKSGQVIIKDPLPHVIGHHNYLKRMFVNLIGNALKFNNGTPIISIRCEHKEELAVIRIIDNGIGMSTEDLAAIFEPFHRLNQKELYEGSGLGLAIVKRIITLHRGTIEVASELGKGSTFIITLSKSL